MTPHTLTMQGGALRIEERLSSREKGSVEVERLTLQAALLKIDGPWTLPKAASYRRSPFLIAMGGRFASVLCGPRNQPCWFFFGTMDESFAASTSRSCANTSRRFETEVRCLRLLD
jgi:hypothetical protein